METQIETSNPQLWFSLAVRPFVKPETCHLVDVRSGFLVRYPGFILPIEAQLLDPTLLKCDDSRYLKVGLEGIFNTGYRGAFSAGRPWLPMSTAGRVIASIGGAVLFLVGIARILRLLH